jgi:hypothetical protein
MKENRKRPCPSCPWLKRAKLEPDGTIGMSSPLVYIGQVQKNFWLPCHSSQNYAGKATTMTEHNHCAGAAIFRTNIGVADKMPKAILTLPEDKENVFATREEFLAHYLRINELTIKTLFKEEDYEYLSLRELNDPNVRKQNL